jgi:hypothetical protein
VGTQIETIEHADVQGHATDEEITLRFGGSLRPSKPTTLLLIRLPHLRDRIMRLSDHGRCSHHAGFHIGLHGKDEKGDFKTSIATIYPVEMNAAIADSVVQCTVFTFCF